MKRQVVLPTINEHEFMLLPESVGWYTEMPDHIVHRKPGMLSNISIHFILGGRGYVDHEGKQHVLQRGDAFLFFPESEQHYYSSLDDPWEVRWVHFYGSGLREYLLERGYHRFPLWKIRSLQPLVSAHHPLLEEAEAHGFLHLTHLSTLTYAILAEFVTQSFPWSDVKSAESGQRILELLPAMRSEARAPFDLDRWAAAAGVSTYYFCRLFKKATAMTPVTFMTLCRLQYSKQRLLELPELPVKLIAEEAGYPSVSYFIKRFHEQEGMTPTEYRQLYNRS